MSSVHLLDLLLSNWRNDLGGPTLLANEIRLESECCVEFLSTANDYPICRTSSLDQQTKVIRTVNTRYLLACNERLSCTAVKRQGI